MFRLSPSLVSRRPLTHALGHLQWWVARATQICSTRNRNHDRNHPGGGRRATALARSDHPTATAESAPSVNPPPNSPHAVLQLPGDLDTSDTSASRAQGLLHRPAKTMCTGRWSSRPGARRGLRRRWEVVCAFGCGPKKGASASCCTAGRNTETCDVARGIANSTKIPSPRKNPENSPRIRAGVTKKDQKSEFKKKTRRHYGSF